MLDLVNLPKDPFDALIFALRHGISKATGGSAKFGDLKAQGHPLAIDIISVCSVIRRAAPFMDDLQTKEILNSISELGDDNSIRTITDGFEHGLNAIIASRLDDHFIDSDSVEMFDRANLDQNEKAEIRELMAKARRLTDQSDILQEWQRKKILYYIAKIENEVHKTRSTFQAFIAAATEISGLVKTVGEDAQPIAEAIQKARTITERKVEGTLMIEKENAQKQLPKPDPSNLNEAD